MFDRNLQLEGYNEEVYIAFDHHGIRYYNYGPFFIKTTKDFNKRKALELYIGTMPTKGNKTSSILYQCYTIDESLYKFL